MNSSQQWVTKNGAYIIYNFGGSLKRVDEAIYSA